jgi:hypothetical protein
VTKKVSRDLSKKQQKKSVNPWDSAIADAEQMIRQSQDTIERLRFSIHFFKQQRDAGLPFPGESAASAELERQ